VRIHYRGPDVVVTSELFIRCGVPPERFAIRDLHNVCVTREEADSRSAANLVAAVAVLAAAGLIYRFAGPWLALALLLLAALSAACFAVRWHHRPRRRILRAEYRGTVVVLYASADGRVFNQVKRALQRAIENGPAMPWLGAAAA
jgi:Family of unknown function (DUF6232)